MHLEMEFNSKYLRELYSIVSRIFVSTGFYRIFLSVNEKGFSIRMKHSQDLSNLFSWVWVWGPPVYTWTMWIESLPSVRTMSESFCQPVARNDEGMCSKLMEMRKSIHAKLVWFYTFLVWILKLSILLKFQILSDLEGLRSKYSCTNNLDYF